MNQQFKKQNDIMKNLSTFDEFLNEWTNTKKFSEGTELGEVEYHTTSIDAEDYYEYGEKDNKNWNKANSWTVIDNLRVYKKYIGNGKKLLDVFIKSIPKGSGILANPVPEDGDISFEILQQWYLKLGFKYFDPSGSTLMYVKK